MSQQAQPHDNEPSTTDAEPNGEGSGRIIRMPRSVTSRTDSAEYKRLQEVARKTRTELKPVFMVLPRPWLSTSILFASDLAAITIAAIIGFIFRNLGSSSLDLYAYLKVSPLLLIIPVLFAWRGLYRIPAHPPAVELRLIITSLIIAFFAFTSLVFLGKQTEAWSRSVWAATAGISLISVPMLRGFTRAVCARRRWWGAPVAILGAGQTGKAIVKQLHKNPGLGLKPIAFFDDYQKPAEDDDIPILGTLDDARDFAQKSGVNHAVVAMPGAPAHRLISLEHSLQGCYPELIIIPPYVGYLGLWVEPRDLGGAFGLKFQRKLLLKGPRTIKTILEWIFVLIGLPFAFLVGLAIAAAIKLTSKGPIFYKQERIGIHGSRFMAYKFRSMHGDGEERLKQLFADNPELESEYAINHKLKNDPRVTAIGKIIRKTSLDELPQLINFLKGEVALIGPRAYLPRELNRIGAQQGTIARVKPGITGLWQVSGRSETTFDERVAIESYYVHNWSPWLDAWILAKTGSVVILGQGAY